MKKYKLILLIAVFACVTSCTDNKSARSYGGTEEISLKTNEKLLGITWKDTDMWVLTQDTLTKVCYFREKSSLGILEGEIIIK